jgi:hypothetical protein
MHGARGSGGGDIGWAFVLMLVIGIIVTGAVLLLGL